MTTPLNRNEHPSHSIHATFVYPLLDPILEIWSVLLLLRIPQARQARKLGKGRSSSEDHIQQGVAKTREIDPAEEAELRQAFDLFDKVGIIHERMLWRGVQLCMVGLV